MNVRQGKCFYTVSVQVKSIDALLSPGLQLYSNTHTLTIDTVSASNEMYFWAACNSTPPLTAHMHFCSTNPPCTHVSVTIAVVVHGHTFPSDFFCILAGSTLWMGMRVLILNYGTQHHTSKVSHGLSTLLV